MNTKNKIFPFLGTHLGKIGMQIKWGIWAGLSLLFLFAELVEDLLHHELETFDTMILDIIRGFASEPLTTIMILITNLGSVWIVSIIFLFSAAFLIIRLKHFWETAMLANSLIGGLLLNQALKVMFHRTRPNIKPLVEAGGYSFPSGHAMVSVAFYGMFGYLLWVYLRNRSKPAWYVTASTILLIMSIGISRVYLGVHFPSDVVAGFAAGGVWLIACIISLNAINFRKSSQD